MMSSVCVENKEKQPIKKLKNASIIFEKSIAFS